MSPSENLTLPFKFKRKEFLVRLSFAMTNNKAWKQTLPNVGVYISEPMLSHARLYVALLQGISKLHLGSC
jgi:hypothetical protein